MLIKITNTHGTILVEIHDHMSYDVVHDPFVIPNLPISFEYMFTTPNPFVIHVHYATIDLIRQLSHDVFAFAS